MTAQHTPTPWRLSSASPHIIKPDYIGIESGCIIASAMGHPNSGFFPSDEEADANAAFIVVACNAHDELIAALHDLEHIFDGQEDCDDGSPNDAMKAMEIIRSALAKAGVKAGAA